MTDSLTFASTSPLLGLPMLFTGQAQKRSSSMKPIRGSTLLSIAPSRAVQRPPAAPSNGSNWLVGTGASGAWNGMEGGSPAISQVTGCLSHLLTVFDLQSKHIAILPLFFRMENAGLGHCRNWRHNHRHPGTNNPCQFDFYAANCWNSAYQLEFMHSCHGFGAGIWSKSNGAAHRSIDGKRGIFATVDEFSRLACNQ
jgi:hypothetical protein